MKLCIVGSAILLLAATAQAETLTAWHTAHSAVLQRASKLCGVDPVYPQPVDTPECNELRTFIHEEWRLWMIEDAKRQEERKRQNNEAIEQALELYRARAPLSEDR